MSTNLIEAGIGVLDKGFGIIDQLVDDGDLAAKLKNQLLTEQMNFIQTLLVSKDVPGYVKLMVALRDFILPMMRPIGGFVLTAGAAWMAAKGIELPDYLMAAMAGAFPGWVVSRHIDKKQEREQETRREEVRALARTDDAFDYGED